MPAPPSGPLLVIGGAEDKLRKGTILEGFVAACGADGAGELVEDRLRRGGPSEENRAAHHDLMPAGVR